MTPHAFRRACRTTAGRPWPQQLPLPRTRTVTRQPRRCPNRRTDACGSGSRADTGRTTPPLAVRPALPPSSRVPVISMPAGYYLPVK